MMPLPNKHTSIGKLSKNAIESSLIERTIEFVWSSLTPWKNDPERPFTESEEDLNAQFHNFLQARASKEFPMVFFQHEQRQEGRRRVDLSAKPTSTTVIHGVSYTIYEPIIVIEGKRLPPPSKSREREYVTGESEISGGIQRFKLGLHGKEHETVIIIGYIQSQCPKFWIKEINKWINDYSNTAPKDWNTSECLNHLQSTYSNETSVACSEHPRVKGCATEKVKIKHFWVVVSESRVPPAK